MSNHLSKIGRALGTVTMMVLSYPNVSFSVQHILNLLKFSDTLFVQLRPFQVALGPPRSTGMKAVMEDQGTQ